MPAGRGRPPKQGLSYHGSEVDYYEDDKIIDLLYEYGPLGQTIYDVIIKKVYRNGYYLEIPMEKLERSVIRTIGSKWVKKGKVLQVIQYCAEIGLFDNVLLQQSVITSVGIQKRYELATVRNKPNKDKYWLLKKESEKPLLSAPKNQILDTNNGISVTENQINDAKIPIKNSTEKDIYISSPKLNEAFVEYMSFREQKYGVLTGEQIASLIENLYSITVNEEEQIKIIKTAIRNGWKDFYPLKKTAEHSVKTEKRAKNFNNFEGRKYDMNNLEKQILNHDGGGN